MIKNIKKIIFVSIFLILFLQNSIFATKLIDTVEHSGKFDDCVFIGDSYTQMLRVYYGGSLDCEGHEGYTVGKLKPYIDNLIKKNKENIVFLIGGNDYLTQTPIENFYNTLVQYIRLLRAKTRSRIFFCSCLDFMYNVQSENFKNFKYKIRDYDNALKELCRKEDIVYVDLWDIGDVTRVRGLSDSDGDNDLVHYGNDFYEDFMKRIRDKITEQQEVERQILSARAYVAEDKAGNNSENKIENETENMNKVGIKNGPGIGIKKEVVNEDDIKESICAVTMIPGT